MLSYLKKLYLGLSVLLIFFLVFKHPSPVFATVLFQDDFNDDNANGWIIPRNQCEFGGHIAQWKVENKQYGIRIDGGSCVTEAIPDDTIWNTSWNNYIFESDITIVKGVDANIAFRHSDILEWYDYHFIVESNPNNSKVVLQRVTVTIPFQNHKKYPLENNKKYHLKIIVDGEHIILYIDDNLVIDYPDAGGLHPTGRIALQASAGSGTSYSEVWFDNVRVTTLDHVDPPDPVGNIPVVVLPGLGGSWNTLAIINGDDSGVWKKTPFVKVYENLRNTFTDNGYVEGDDYFEFYYDWRQPVDGLADRLNEYVNNVVLAGKSSDTRVNLVGHSMGGMVARAYAQKYGDRGKINKLVTTGSPHQGAIKAWQGWVGAEVGDRWSWEWIGLQLYLQIHKGDYSSPVEAVHGLAPGLNDLMPIFDFAKNSNNQVIPVEEMDSFNNYLNELKTSLTDVIKDLMRTIAGNAPEDSQEWVRLAQRSLIDKLLGKWPDGKPESYEYTPDGDLTVLEKSALIDGTAQTVVNSNHTNLVQSQDGIQAIIDGLGLTIAPSTESSDLPRNPSLVFFLHSPADLRVTSPDGLQAGFGVDSPMANVVYSDDDKLLVIYKAIEGSYQVEIVGNGDGRYSLELGQLTANGEKWSTTEGKTSPGQVDSYRLDFKSDQLKDFPWSDESGKLQLNMAKFRLEMLIEYIEEQNMGRIYKRMLIAEIKRIIKLIDKSAEQKDKGRGVRYLYLAESAMNDCYLLRIKINGMTKRANIEESVRIKMKLMAHEAGELLLEGLTVNINQNIKKINNNHVLRLISLAEKMFEININRWQYINQENHELGVTLELSEEMLTKSKEALSNNDFLKAQMLAGLSKLLSWEAMRIKL